MIWDLPLAYLVTRLLRRAGVRGQIPAALFLAAWLMLVGFFATNP